MTEKFNIHKEVDKLKEIYDAQKPTKEQYQKAVIGNLPSANNPDVKDFNKFLYPERPATTPAEGLEKKMRYWKSKDTDTQERIRFAQSFNLAVQLVSGFEGLKEMKDTDLEQFIEHWQPYFFEKLNNGDENGKPE